jgi:5'-nucleotidase
VTGRARRLIGGVGLALLVSACFEPSGTGTQAPAAPVTLSIVGTNDLHGGILPVDGRGGLALLGGYLANLRAVRARDGAVVLVDAGDMWQGTLESNLNEGAVVVAAYNALGYAAASIGNHEFDFGPAGPPATPVAAGDDPRGALKQRASESRFPFLAANVIDATTGRTVAWPNVRPSTTVEAAGVTVGIIGLTTRLTLASTIAANTGGLAIAPLDAAARTEAERLRAEGADVVIVAAHAGGTCRDTTQPSDVSSCDADSEVFQLARSLPPGLVDVIVAGHTHAALAHEINGIAIIESFSRGRAFGRVVLVVEPATGRTHDVRLHRPRDLCEFADAAGGCLDPGTARPQDRAAYEGRPVEPLAEVEAVLAPAIAQVARLKATELGVEVLARVPVRGRAESALGNLFVDAMLATAPGADVAINNTDGGLRADLPAGPLTYGRLFEVFPFDNRLVRLSIAAGDLERVFRAHIRQSNRLLGVAGLRVEAACDGGTLTIGLRRPSGEAVADTEMLDVATTDFLAIGPLFSSIVPAGGPEIPADAPIVRDAIADWFRQRGGRIDPAALVGGPARFPPRETLPVRCRDARPVD